MERWAIYLDIEGTSKIYPKDEYRYYLSFDALLEAVIRIGRIVYSDEGNRLFAHQIGGDALLIVSNSLQGLPEIPISIAVVMMQRLLLNGAVAKGGISVGTFGNQTDCFPSLERFGPLGEDGKSLSLGAGLLTIFPVMGTALINAHRVESNPPRGTRLAIDIEALKEVPSGMVISKKGSDHAIIDYIHTRTQTMEDISKGAGLRLASVDELSDKLVSYIQSAGPLGQGEWGKNSLKLNGCYPKKTCCLYRWIASFGNWVRG
jgi:hypothetical protein